MLKHRKQSLAVLTSATAAALTLSACSTAAEDSSDATATVVATTTQVGSVAEQITECAGGHTDILMSPADDPHQFEASSAQIADMITADLVVTNGLGLESAMQRSIDNAITDGADVLEIAPELDPLPLQDDHHHDADHDHDHDHEHGAYDPHVWMDVARMADGATLLGDRLAEVTSDETYQTCGQEVSAELLETDAQIAELLSEIDSAKLVTDHAAYGYFADRYGLEVTGVVIPGGSTDGEPSSQALTDLTDLLDDQGADALVTSKSNTNRMITALAAETDSDIPVVELYESALGAPDSDAATYQEAMLYNARALVDALGS